MFNTSVFGEKQKIQIPVNCDIVFVADLFTDDYVGGAELTSEALIQSSHLNVFKLHSQDVTMDVLKDGKDKFWIFGNFASMNYNLIPTIITNIKYAILEYDYKFCKFRSVEKHKVETGNSCDCHNDVHGKIISTFFCAAKSLWWMSQKQKERYENIFGFLKDHANSKVLSSVFNIGTLDTLKTLRNNKKEDKWIVLNSESWIKGAEAAKTWCKNNKVKFDAIWGLGYQDTLKKLSLSKGFVYTPLGGDTCPRMVIEAKLLGCKLHLNDNVQHKDEKWFSTDDIDLIDDYLRNAHTIFWDGIQNNINDKKSLSGYTTTKNCIEQKYPFKQSILSMLSFCDEVCVVDGGSSDGTWEELEELAKSNDKLKIHKITRDWDDTRFAVFDGLQKAEARKLCTKDFCWQMDSDEIVHEDDGKKIHNIINNFPSDCDLLALPVVEYWGSLEKVRCDINSWKWRLSRNKKNITHGIPKQFRKYDDNGNLYAGLGTDGCDYIDTITFEPIGFMTFCDSKVNELQQYVHDIPEALDKYEQWFNNVIQQLPPVFHYSWFNIERKILTYKNYWSKHWQSLFDISQQDTAENNMFFNKPWSDVTDDDISQLALKLKNEMGGWVFHRKVDFREKTKSITCNRNQPAIMKDWAQENVTK
jgi:glycosyltransferase involved in cell wall biosynthesis